MATRIYHWKHGWIPLDHVAALSKAKGSHKGAARELAKAHAAGHAHHSVVKGTYHDGTHVRGLQPVAREHLKREDHIIAAFNPASRSFHVMQRSRIEGRPDHLATVIPEHLADHFNERGHFVKRLLDDHDGHKIVVATPEGGVKVFKADGTDKLVVDPPAFKPEEHVGRHRPDEPGDFDGYAASHEIRKTSMGDRDYAVITPKPGTGGSRDVIDLGLAEHIEKNDLRVIGYKSRVVSTVDRAGVVRRFKADGSNIDKPVMARKAPPFQGTNIGPWTQVEPRRAIPGDDSLGATVHAAKVKRAYVNGNKRVLIESHMTDAQAWEFMLDVERAFKATADQTAGMHITVRVPSGDRHLIPMGNAMGYAYRGNAKVLHVAPSVADGSYQRSRVHSNSTGFKMPVHDNVSQLLYTLTHEIGHLVDSAHSHTNHGQLDRPTEVGFHEDHKHGMSQYGASSAVEGYAEAFTQHMLGKYTSAAAHAKADEYARRYRW